MVFFGLPLACATAASPTILSSPANAISEADACPVIFSFYYMSMFLRIKE
jgi:hypothetical protein